MPSSLDPELAEAMHRWVYRTYGTIDSDGLQAAIDDMDKIARGLPVGRWGSKLEVVR